MTILYLVSAERPASAEEGPKGYWKIGITDRKDRNPLNRDRNRYREVFRSLEMPKGDARAIELIVARTFGVLRKRFNVEDCGRESLPYPFTLDHALSVLDFWLEVADSSERYVDGFDGRSTLDGTTLDECNGRLTAWTVANALLWFCSYDDEECLPYVDEEGEGPSCGPGLYWVGSTCERYTPPEISEPIKSDYARRWFAFASVWGNKLQIFLDSISIDLEPAAHVAQPQEMWA